MKFFVSYRFTGEDPKVLEKNMKIICSTLEGNGHKNYCTFWNADSLSKTSKKELMNYAFKEIDNSDGLFVFLNSENKSEGMLIEVGYALARKKKIFLAVSKKLKNTYLREIADNFIEFDNVKELENKIKEIKI